MTPKIKIIADNKIPFLKGVLEPFADVVYLPGREISPDKIKDADALIIRTRTKCNRELLEESKVSFIATATIGFDHIDTGYCESREIFWQNAPGCNSSSVEQYVLSALLAISETKAFRLEGSTIGIVGAGHVGTKIEKIARILGMIVLLNDPPRERNEGGSDFVPLKKIQEESDIITFHVPLTRIGRDKTYHMVDRQFLNNLGKKVHFINTSRGEVVDERDLKDSIAHGRLGSVVLDVWENEPLIDSDLLEAVDIATPHIAGYSLDGKAGGTQMSVGSLCRYFGIELKSWPGDLLPAPSDSQIIIDTAGRAAESVISEAVLRTYNILEDDMNFRNSPGSFEEQREYYHFRREYGAYTVHLLNDNSNINALLKKLGFALK